MSLKVCAHCGEMFQEGRPACPHCGADADLTWSDEEQLVEADFAEDDEDAPAQGGDGRRGCAGAVLAVLVLSATLSLLLL